MLTAKYLLRTPQDIVVMITHFYLLIIISYDFSHYILYPK